MNGAFYIGGIGLSSQQQALDVIANNIANMNTRSFKRSDVQFSEIMAASGNAANPVTGSDTAPSAAGVNTNVQFMLNEQGALEATNHALDLAIDGDGFIELIAPRGETMLWRGGTLRVREDGMLTAENGMMLKAMINVPLDASSIEISTDGTVNVTTDQDEHASEIGQVMLINVNGSSGLERLDGGIYRVMDDASMFAAVPGEDGVGHLVQGSIERSNVDLNSEMVQMMIVQRAYAANAQIVQAADQMLSIANNLRR